MPRRRLYRSPDGLDWRDPEMPVIRKMQDTGEGEEFSPTEVTEAHKHWLVTSDEPHFKHDPTYNLRKKRNGKV